MYNYPIHFKTFGKGKKFVLFLHGWGGRLSKYGRLDERRCLYSVEEILPMSETEAKVWAECHMDGDEYETLFGEVEE